MLRSSLSLLPFRLACVLLLWVNCGSVDPPGSSETKHLEECPGGGEIALSDFNLEIIVLEPRTTADSDFFIVAKKDPLKRYTHLVETASTGFNGKAAALLVSISNIFRSKFGCFQKPSVNIEDFTEFIIESKVNSHNAGYMLLAAALTPKFLETLEARLFSFETFVAQLLKLPPKLSVPLRNWKAPRLENWEAQHLEESVVAQLTQKREIELEELCRKDKLEPSLNAHLKEAKHLKTAKKKRLKDLIKRPVHDWDKELFQTLKKELPLEDLEKNLLRAFERNKLFRELRELPIEIWEEQHLDDLKNLRPGSWGDEIINVLADAQLAKNLIIAGVEDREECILQMVETSLREREKQHLKKMKEEEHRRNRKQRFQTASQPQLSEMQKEIGRSLPQTFERLRLQEQRLNVEGDSSAEEKESSSMAAAGSSAAAVKGDASATAESNDLTVRVVVMFSEPYNYAELKGTKFRGDGHDTCASGYPSLEQVKNIFDEARMGLVVATVRKRVAQESMARLFDKDTCFEYPLPDSGAAYAYDKNADMLPVIVRNKAIAIACQNFPDRVVKQEASVSKKRKATRSNFSNRENKLLRRDAKPRGVKRHHETSQESGKRRSATL